MVRHTLSDCCLSVLSVCDVGILWPNGWMDRDETSHAGRPWPWLHCVRWGPSSPPPKGCGAPEPPIFGPYLLWPNGWMINMKLGMQVGLGPGHIVSDRYPAPPPPKGGRAPPILRPYLLWPNGWIDQYATW